MYLFLLLAALIVLALGWCMLSSCIGAPILSALSEMWQSAVAGSRTASSANIRRRRTDFGAESEMWEMEARGRGG
ncbi:hypothetical protein DENSPDRAFT_837443 [Dentipellis sp. KUC8613]|nr:hypothetical protein DENSPDRAFT_837443 [Dentipellis sp. KUC8613]